MRILSSYLDYCITDFRRTSIISVYRINLCNNLIQREIIREGKFRVHLRFYL
ncbi:hypothetical protein GLOIN_2v1709311 [Rhizophagus irregularis DAOM 181602=DAOM 197198]|uniref:Uncharacterized protein n=1 Tax=Rhizophagus irregularis (strain DAOM 181602 / DAOM 197198 / MUCL 43194) TaxID=747089 RepID=A0A2P4P650_RHIID|nr:hypothetical protein GLOIN_2v1709311 [Rhizophagus irregularis DAOM 181602=DAOM 197198]POG60863.1 hypothetical protein GLOIN_2v1709311 [Rhizophagus irregularis DAOM 181602=DAOM 197198]|eukprot:XP_025167729.1 hypothetical protein GLOIN_2v1709311 [Rhizophagus irregularis DAOM 181602=DAOM 197198]